MSRKNIDLGKVDAEKKLMAIDFAPVSIEPGGSENIITGNLASRVAELLLSNIRDLAPGTRLPSETALATQFGVSRTVIRQSIALLRADGILETRKGSGTFVLDRKPADRSASSPLTDQSIQDLLNLLEVRRSIEAETARLAAIRRSPGQLVKIEHSLRRLAEAVAVGSDGVDEDARFHRAIAAATGNPYWVRFSDMFARQIHSTITVTRANARRNNVVGQVLREHQKILDAIAAGDAAAAQTAAAEHMEHAAERVRAADLDIWQGEGGRAVREIEKSPS